MARITIDNMSFYAFHGCFAEESTIGTHFSVDCEFDCDTSKAETSDKLFGRLPNYTATDGNPFPTFGTSLQENSRLSFGYLSANGLLQGSGSQAQSAVGRSDEGSERLS